MQRASAASSLPIFGGAAGAPLVLLFGLSDSTWNGLTLPLNLAFLGYPTCNVLVAGHLMISATADVRGRALFSFPVPNLQQLVGLRRFHQVVGVDSSLIPALTNGFVAQLS